MGCGVRHLHRRRGTRPVRRTASRHATLAARPHPCPPRQCVTQTRFCRHLRCHHALYCRPERRHLLHGNGGQQQDNHIRATDYPHQRSRPTQRLCRRTREEPRQLQLRGGLLPEVRLLLHHIRVPDKRLQQGRRRQVCRVLHAQSSGNHHGTHARAGQRRPAQRILLRPCGWLRHTADGTRAPDRRETLLHILAGHIAEVVPDATPQPDSQQISEEHTEHRQRRYADRPCTQREQRRTQALRLHRVEPALQPRFLRHAREDSHRHQAVLCRRAERAEQRQVEDGDIPLFHSAYPLFAQADGQGGYRGADWVYHRCLGHST